ncbi:hypothetical protein C0Q70_07635 [Pomacea canaliculata]|uniref:Lipocalin/cytosolic fatty-acid binding domain-containing protein n=1 Tax=Pomacea canaliculata TaxID=400727 RepID=A0A2T7PFK6_POMCA|nr:hypothetical protein C0Q70_07635 [Pomacea canaliculata]
MPPGVTGVTGVRTHPHAAADFQQADVNNGRLKMVEEQKDKLRKPLALGAKEDAESDSSTSDNEEQPGSSKAIVKRPAFYGSVLGMWRLQSSEFFDEFLQDLGVSHLRRRLSLNLGTFEEILRDGDNWTIRISTPIKAKEINFQIQKPFEIKSFDGKLVKVVITLDAELKKMVVRQLRTSPGESLVNIVREVLPDDSMRSVSS